MEGGGGDGGGGFGAGGGGGGRRADNRPVGLAICRVCGHAIGKGDFNESAGVFYCRACRRPFARFEVHVLPARLSARGGGVPRGVRHREAGDGGEDVAVLHQSLTDAAGWAFFALVLAALPVYLVAVAFAPLNAASIVVLLLAFLLGVPALACAARAMWFLLGRTRIVVLAGSGSVRLELGVIGYSLRFDPERIEEVDAPPDRIVLRGRDGQPDVGFGGAFSPDQSAYVATTLRRALVGEPKAASSSAGDVSGVRCPSCGGSILEGDVDVGADEVRCGSCGVGSKLSEAGWTAGREEPDAAATGARSLPPGVQVERFGDSVEIRSPTGQPVRGSVESAFFLLFSVLMIVVLLGMSQGGAAFVVPFVLSVVGVALTVNAVHGAFGRVCVRVRPGEGRVWNGVWTLGLWRRFDPEAVESVGVREATAFSDKGEARPGAATVYLRGREGAKDVRVARFRPMRPAAMVAELLDGELRRH